MKISRDQNILIVTVADNGIGMKKEELPLIFNRYYSNSRGVTERGTGLGLVISKEIVKTHGGRMEVESEEGKGSTFSIYLPIKEIIESGN